MGNISQVTEFGKILIFLIGGAVFVLGGYFTSWLLRPNRPNPEKQTTYECGEDPVGSSWVQFNIRFYVVALIFIIFDVEIVFIFPWATVFAETALLKGIPSWGIFAFVEMFIFIAILLIGLFYAWGKGDLAWIRPKISVPEVGTKVPAGLYEELNRKKYTPVPFSVTNGNGKHEVKEPEGKTV